MGMQCLSEWIDPFFKYWIVLHVLNISQKCNIWLNCDVSVKCLRLNYLIEFESSRIKLLSPVQIYELNIVYEHCSVYTST